LWRSAETDAKGELAGRINVPLSILVLALLAIPLSYVNNRAKRSYGLIIALLLYFIYNNLMSVTQSWIAQGKLGLTAGLLAAHLPVIAALAVLYVNRMQLKPVISRLVRKWP
jgi:lipopolysaccharide export system permease protein